ncbi:class I SAM-dependent methyltransferase [Mycobacterium sp. 21AC1]|uniref:class I SAM-dependent methyltransferase n=1 Tax=[Mycobacterium] appelbergii TaxID=2939269 RepID=UPI0029391042|nr:class I SAM-dependent methyltransferase [Mycobacterium sp. 21AC1]MDV3125679.1 class I SAM-dependent methyltransferase [Mycobacterium sp. 21AC1]
MARRDDDSWDITESVGATALAVAMARADETTSEHPLFTDPYAQAFLDAATARGWRRPRGPMAERIRAISGYAASRTKWFDEFFIAAGANGIRQSVILGAGLDSRAWRLPWIQESAVYEIDQPQVLQFKAEVLQSQHAQPGTHYVAVPVDLRQDWPKSLQAMGFDATQPTAWSVEGLLPYLPADAQDVLFERITGLSALGSRVGVEAFAAEFFTERYLARRRDQMRQLREQAGAAGEDMPDPEGLWFIEERAMVTEWLSERGWQVSMIEADDLMARYHRAVSPDAEGGSMPTEFVEAVLVEHYES